MLVTYLLQAEQKVHERRLQLCGIVCLGIKILQSLISILQPAVQLICPCARKYLHAVCCTHGCLISLLKHKVTALAPTLVLGALSCLVQ